MRRSADQRRRDRDQGIDGRGYPLPRWLGTNPRDAGTNPRAQLLTDETAQRPAAPARERGEVPAAPGPRPAD